LADRGEFEIVLATLPDVEVVDAIDQQVGDFILLLNYFFWLADRGIEICGLCWLVFSGKDRGRSSAG
jgi:hypothetical protein